MKIKHLLENDEALINSLSSYVDNPTVYNRMAINNAWYDLVELYPNHKGTLYRGINFKNKDDYQKFLKNLPQYKTENITSWTHDYDEAYMFAKVAPQSIDFMTPEKWEELSKKDKHGEKVSGYGGIVLSLSIESGVGIDLGKSGVSLENEVLLPSGRYNVSYKEVFSFKRELSDIDVNEVVKNMNTIDKEKLEYILINHYDVLDLTSFSRIYKMLWETPKFNITKSYNVVTEHYDVKLNLKYSPTLLKHMNVFPEKIQKSIKESFSSTLEDIQRKLNDIINNIDSEYELYGFNILDHIKRKVSK